MHRAAEADALESEAKSRNTAGISLVAVGASVGIAAAVWALIDALDPGHAALVVPSGTGLAVEGRF